LEFASVAMIVSSAFAGSAFSADISKQRSHDFTSCYAGVATAIQFSNTNFGATLEHTGAIFSSPPGSIFDHMTFHCLGSQLSLGGKVSRESACETIDRDGDKTFNHNWTSSDGKLNHELLASTGKHEGIEFSSTVQNLGPFPTVKPGAYQGCIRESGTYKVKWFTTS